MASRLLRIAPYEAENQTELSLKQAFELLESKLRPPFPLTIPSSQEYSQLNMAILYGVLCEPHVANIHIKHLHAIVTDGYSSFVSLVIKIVNELYSKLVESVKIQLVWLTKEMIHVSAVGIDGLLVSLLRQIVGGDSSEGNLWLCFELVSLFSANWVWFLDEEPMVLASALFTYLRLLADHCRLFGNAKLEAIKRVEIDFCVRVLREQFHLCLKIGRDLVRLLQELVHVPEFRSIWKDLLLNPSKFGTAGFSDISQIYRVRTSSRYFLLRITPEMETQLRFLLTHVKFGSQRRYQAWFSRRFLCGPERESLICDIVRFICCAHHPPNKIIHSVIIQRWAVIGWLLKSCRINYVEANVKLALFYDWLFFDERVDNIMNIEPAMLLMVYSIPEYIEMTHNLLEFLFLHVDNYDPDRNQLIAQGVLSAFGVLRKRAGHIFNILTSCDALSPFLKERLVRFLKANVSKEPQTAHLPCHSVPPMSLPNLPGMEIEKLIPRGPRKSAFSLKDGSSTELVETNLLFSAEHVTSSSTLVASRESEVETIQPQTAHLPGHSVPPMSLPTSSDMEIEKPIPGGLKKSAFFLKDGSGIDPVDTSIPVLGEPVTSSSPLVVSSESQVDTVERLVQSLGETFGKSYAMSLETLEEIMFSLVNLDTPRLPSCIVDIASHKIAKVFELNGYKLFSPFEFLPDETSWDTEIQSATALLTRTLIFSQHERMMEMFLFWSRDGFPVGTCLLSYAARLAYESHMAGYLQNTMHKNDSNDANESGMPLLKYHSNGYISYLSGRRKNSPEAIDSTSEMDTKLVAMLLDDAFGVYRRFLTYSINILHEGRDTSLAKLLFSDLMSCSEWEQKRLKFFLRSVFFHLSDIFVGEEDFIRLLVSRLDHADLLVIQFEMGLKKFSVFGGNTTTIFHMIRNSLNWGFVEQHKLWGLIRSEFSVSKIQVEKLILQFFCSGVIDLNVSSVAVAGLLTLCSCRAPTPELVGAIMLLPNDPFQGFSAAVLATWVASNASMLFDSLVDFLEKVENKNGVSVVNNLWSGTVINHSALSWLLNYFDAQGVNGNDIVNKLFVDFPDKKSMRHL